MQGRRELGGRMVRTASLGKSLVQVPDGDQLLLDDSVHLAALPGYKRPSRSRKQWQPGCRTGAAREGAWAEAARETAWAGKEFLEMAGGTEDTVKEEALRRFDSSFRSFITGTNTISNWTTGAN